MKRIWVSLVNILIMASILTFVVIYSTVENKRITSQQITHFEDTTLTMEHVTENYLEGEQRICDVWAHYINDKNMTMEEAQSFIQVSHVLDTASAHLVYCDTLEGLSTRHRPDSETDYNVDYSQLGILDDLSWINTEVGATINVSHSYTNPIDSIQVIAFCNFIKLNKEGTLKDAILLRLLPSEEMLSKWEFLPKEVFENADLCIIDSKGYYIIRENAFKNDNFFNFYKNYNPDTPEAYIELFDKMTTSSGSFMMKNSDLEECILAHVPFSNVKDLGWTILSMMPSKYLVVGTQNWLLIGIITTGLVALFIFDVVVMVIFNRQLRATAKEADSANKAKTNFLSAMSHDIRTPMNAIIGLTTITEKNLDDKKLVQDNLRKISLASNHLLTLINDILDISKVESGKLNLVPQTFSIVEIVENLMNLSQPTIKEKNIGFSFRVSQMDKEYLYGDQLRINQIYINLLSNAIKYTERNGKVSVDMIEENSDKEGYAKLTYRVADTGIGMSKEFLANLYQPFSRQTDSRVNKIQGTGLGLAITKRMVDLMGGTIECQSEEGKGTTFTVVLELPVADQQSIEMKLEPIDILLTDDDEVLLSTGKETLESLGLSVDTASSGSSALEMIKNKHKEGHDYRIVIIDLKMPDMDGVKTIQKIHEEVDENISTILISAYDISDIDEEIKKANISGFLSKPLFRSTLFNKISEILGNETKVVEQENEYADLAGLNILVAEDNDINWEIISTLLSMYGINAERAENGLVALNKIKEAKKDQYKLIFMDIQMPEMNGLEATRAIRSLKDSYASNIPIIAMTADAFAENIAECLDAGMNGHISKPIDIKLVLKEIRRIKDESNE